MRSVAARTIHPTLFGLLFFALLAGALSSEPGWLAAGGVVFGGLVAGAILAARRAPRNLLFVIIGGLFAGAGIVVLWVRAVEDAPASGRWPYALELGLLAVGVGFFLVQRGARR